MKHKPDRNNKTSAGRGFFGRLIRGLVVFIDILVGAALFASAYAGNVSPLKYGGAWGIAGLAFGPVLAVAVLLLVLQLIWFRKGALLMALFMLSCAGPIFTFCPLNMHFGPEKPGPDKKTFRIMAYNVANLQDQRAAGSYDSSYNAMVSYMLAMDPDIICLSEAADLGVYPRGHITAQQYDSLQRRYPHIIISGRAQATLSKYPIEPIHVSLDRSGFSAGDVGIYRVCLPGGKLMTLFNCHLESLGLNDGDKEVYRELTELHSEDFSNVRNRLLRKIADANVARARQTQMLLGVIRHYGGPNVIICGDFNDVPDCYAIRTFGDAGFRSVYPQLGFGPMVTFNANRFYFCIDHILYRGDLRPLDIEKGTLKASDHYPLTAEFEY